LSIIFFDTNRIAKLSFKTAVHLPRDTDYTVNNVVAMQRRLLRICTVEQ